MARCAFTSPLSFSSAGINGKTKSRTNRNITRYNEANKKVPRMVFTGIVEEMGIVDNIKNVGSEDGAVSLTINCSKSHGDANIGDSISVNGTCLSITHITGSSLTFGLVPETLSRTNLGALGNGSYVNLERSMSSNGRFGGHIMQGHVDCTGVIQNIRQDKEAIWYTIQIPEAYMKYVVEKGYIAVDGASLTVVDAFSDSFTFTMIPITQESVVTARKNVGDRVNIEVDITAKYIERMLECRNKK